MQTKRKELIIICHYADYILPKASKPKLHNLF